ncbi:uncharacterized protein JN550_007771 [Neoarthrinium moseri]|uniref:uncharacterized protein n=1 Tax=Neoarthrinium moseri TaxID=1658444 RepID=UPI001FDC9C66|nr:uncharacterized protein JN550_007771 [Neoarthrinium moseri]KAI1866082.1 hypothetical protein JN550_007771 [Neoarthrinium moseri]
MDPSAMDFSPPSNRGGLTPMSLDHQHSSPCPALRAAAAEQHQLPGVYSHPRGSHGYRYDPVHNGAAGGSWWHQPPPDVWSHPPVPPHLARSVPHMYAPPFPGPPGLMSPMGVPHGGAPQYLPFGLVDNYGSHGHPHPQGHPSPPYNPRPTIPSLDRIGGTAPTQHSQSGFGTPRESSVTMPPMPQSAADSASDGNRLFGGNGRNRRPTMPMPSSEPSSDEDSDPSDLETSTLRMLESISAGGPAFSGPDGGLRAAQLLRGTAAGKRVASKTAIASLESVKLSDLPESERTCIICYNDFGTQTPEGINEAPLRLPKCKHVFGDHCIKKWFEESDSCPYCRDKVPSEAQFRHTHPQAIFQYMRQHQIHTHRHQREAGSRDRAGENGGSPPFPMITDFHDFGNRRADLQVLRNSAWQYAERRSPPNEFGEGRRRTRARHGSLRGSPPSLRPNQHITSTTTGHSSSPFPPGGRPYPFNHAHRHSVAFASPAPPRLSDAPTFEPNISAPYMGSLPGMQNETAMPQHYPNPLASNDADAFRPGWHPVRTQPYTSTTISGPEVNMADAEGSPRVPSSHQRP